MDRRQWWFATLLTLVAALTFVPIALAKGEDVVATLDTALPTDAAPGEELELAWTLTVAEDDGTILPFVAEGIFVRLLSSSAGPTEFRARQDRMGHYVTTITVPEGGLGAIEIGLAGSACLADRTCTRSDELFTVSDVTNDATTVAGSGSEPAAPAEPSTPLLGYVAVAVGAIAALLLVRRGRRDMIGSGPTPV